MGKYHSVLLLTTDTANGNDEILSIYLRYVNNDNEICEVFTELVELEIITGEAIGNAIIKFYNDTGVEIAEWRGQCLNAAANMQSQKKRCSVICSQRITKSNSYPFLQSQLELISRIIVYKSRNRQCIENK